LHRLYLNKEEGLDCSFEVREHFLNLESAFFFGFVFAIDFACFDKGKLDPLWIFLSLF